VADSVQALGSVDIFVSNAGIIEWEPVTRITLIRGTGWWLSE
jgi:hypothetical protein